MFVTVYTYNTKFFGLFYDRSINSKIQDTIDKVLNPSTSLNFFYSIFINKTTIFKYNSWSLIIKCYYENNVLFLYNNDFFYVKDCIYDFIINTFSSLNIKYIVVITDSKTDTIYPANTFRINNHSFGLAKSYRKI